KAGIVRCRARFAEPGYHIRREGGTMTNLVGRFPARLHLSACLLAALALTGVEHNAAAAAVTDCVHDSGAGTLRNVIAAAATGGTVDASACTNSTITLSSGQISIALKDLNIVGPADDSLTISANHQSRVFNHTGSGTLTLQHMHLVDGTVTSATA